MFAVFRKEIASFFSTSIGYLVVIVFLLIMGLFLWVFPDTSILNYGYAGMDQMFELAPLIFIFLIPAITMKSLAEEYQSGTIEFISTKPISDWGIVFAKFLSSSVLVAAVLLPTLVYLYSVYSLASPKGNIDMGAIVGSYIGLFLLCMCFVSIGLLCSALTKNQIVAFILGAFMCFFFYWAFLYLSKLPLFFGSTDLLVEKLGIDYHYKNLSKGAIDTRSVIYFFSFIGVFLFTTMEVLKARKNR